MRRTLFTLNSDVVDGQPEVFSLDFLDSEEGLVEQEVNAGRSILHALFDLVRAEAPGRGGH